MDYNSFAGQCFAELQELQDKFQAECDLNWYEHWFCHEPAGLLTFSKGESALNFKYFQVGSFSPQSNTWQWAWDNNDLPDNVKETSRLVMEFGEQSGYSQLVNGHFPGDEYEAWEFTAIAAKLTNAIGVYRPVMEGQLQVYLVITEFVDNKTAQELRDKYVK